MPTEARTLALAERFHVLPWRLEREAVDDVLRWQSILSVEGEVLADRAGLTPNDPIYYEDEDEDEEETLSDEA